MTGMGVSFGGLTVDQARRLTDLYESLIGAGTPVSYAATEYDTARELVEQPPVTILTTAQAQDIAAGRPVAPVAQTVATSFDQTGVPYNPDYHTSTRAITVKGEWKLRKGVNKDAAEAWRRQHAGKGTVQASAPSPTPPAAPAVAQQVMPSAPNPTPPAATYAPDYGTWYGTFGAAHASGKMTEAVLNQINAAAGVPDASHYASNEHARAVSFPMLQQLAA